MSKAKPLGAPGTVVRIKQTADAEVPIEVLADAIVAMSQGIKKLRAGKLNDRALFLLIQNASPTVGQGYRAKPLSIAAIKAVFEGIESLERAYTKKPAPPA